MHFLGFHPSSDSETQGENSVSTKARQDIYETKRVSTWNGLVRLYDMSNWATWDWAFRGENTADKHLCTSLERNLRRIEGFDFKKSPNVEYRLVREFKRQAQHFIASLPKANDILEWLSIMRHHGAPTRLLDWTYSFYVAAYFAIRRAKPKSKCAIWAIDVDWLESRAVSSLPKQLQKRWENLITSKKPELLNSVFERQRTMVFPLNSFRLNERLVIQQGLFLVPGDITKSFMDNLAAVAPRNQLGKKFLKIEITVTEHFLRQAFIALRSMNINEATLFPGIDGFSRSLSSKPIDMDPKRFGSENAFRDIDI
jgi:hypothetical protein